LFAKNIPWGRTRRGPAGHRKKSPPAGGGRKKRGIGCIGGLCIKEMKISMVSCVRVSMLVKKGLIHPILTITREFTDIK
jgi:hypothetical protein